MRQNFETVGQGKLRRGRGWRKLLSSSSYNNEDFHDQLLALSPGAIRQPITLLFEAQSTRQVRSLIAATQCRVAQLNEYSGNWRILGDGYGGTPVASAAGVRFKADQLGDYLVFTNDFDPPMYHRLEGSPVDNSPLMQTFDDLAVIGLTRAAVVWVWRSCLFFADVEMDRERFSNRLIWSDFNNPLSFDPAKLESITGFKDLYDSERILAARPFGNTLLIYSDKGIWECAAVGGSASFAFARRYNGEDNKGAAVLKYPNTLVGLSDAHTYASEDGLYVYSPFYLKPERLEWLHRATPVLGYNEPGEEGAFGSVDDQNCQVHCAIGNKTQALFSFAGKGAPNQCPDRSLLVNLSYDTASFVDAGFTALCDYRSFKVGTIRDFIVENRICTLEGLADAGFPFGKEGLPKPLPSAQAEFQPNVFFTHETQTIDGVTIEDWNQSSAAADSLCRLLGARRAEESCRACEGPTLLIGASSGDLCLKELLTGFYRERCANPEAVGSTNDLGYDSAVGSYVLDGYDSTLTFAPVFAPLTGAEQNIIQLDQVLLNAMAVAADQPAKVGLQIGISAQTADPNIDNGRIKWFRHSDKLLKYLSTITAKTVPSDLEKWNLYRVGRVIYIRIKITGVGGDSELSNVVGKVGTLAARNF
jgi:hypothetical protein